MSINLKTYKNILKFIWLGLLLLTLVIYLTNSSSFTVENFIRFCEDNQESIMVSYVVFALLRALVFIPSTVVLVLGIALFPDQFWFLLIVNMLGILVGASLIYAAGKFFTSEDFFSAKHQKKLPVIKEKINRYGFWIVLGWSFFPFVPTDLICYVSGATHMRYIKFLGAVFVGELFLVSLYLTTGQGLFELIF